MKKIITIKKDFLIDEEKLRATIATINFDNITGNDQNKYFYLQNNYLFNRHIHHIVSNFIQEMHSIFIKNIDLYDKVEKERRNKAMEDHSKENSSTTYSIASPEETVNFENYLKKYNIQSILEEEVRKFLIDTQVSLKAKRQKINQDEIKRAQLSITNSLLIEILNNLFDAKDSPYRLKSTTIYGLNTYHINSKLHDFYFSMQKLDNGLAIKKAENDFIKIKKLQEKNLEDLELQEYRFIERHTKKEKSLIGKIKRAEIDIEFHLEEIAEDKKVSEKKRLEKNIETDKENLTTLKNKHKKEIQKFIEEIAKSRQKFIDSIEPALDDYSESIKDTNEKVSKLKENKSKYDLDDKPKRPKKEEYFFTSPLKYSLNQLSITEMKNIKRKKPDLIFDVLNYLKTHGLISQEDVLDDNGFYYKLKLDDIFKKAAHPISDSYIYAVNIPFILAYLKYSPIHNMKSFLDNIDILLSYSLKPPEDFSEVKKNEDILIQAGKEEKAINISLENNKNIYQVEDFHIYYDDDYEKYLSLTIPQLNIESIDNIYYTNKQNKHITILKKKDKFYKNKLLLDAISREEKLSIEITSEIKLSDVIATIKEIGPVPEIKQDEKIEKDENIEQNKKVEAIKSITLSNAYSNIKFKDIQLIKLYTGSEESNNNTDQLISKDTSGFITHQQKYCIPDKAEHNTILEVDIHLTDFFDIKPLKNQIIYKTPEKIELFLMENGLESIQVNGDSKKRDTKNKVYVSAKDTKDNIIHVTKRCIPNVRILEPTIIDNEFKALIKDICDE